MQLNIVVLPAPLGPMRANTSPPSTSKLTLSTATRPPKRLVTPLTRRMAAKSGLQLTRGRDRLVLFVPDLLLADLARQEALRAQQHDPDEDHAEYDVFTPGHHPRDPGPASWRRRTAKAQSQPRRAALP